MWSCEMLASFPGQQTMTHMRTVREMRHRFRLHSHHATALSQWDAVRKAWAPHSRADALRGGKFATSEAPSQLEMAIKKAEDSPAPWDYSHNLDIERKGAQRGATISEAMVPSDVDIMMRRARGVPGPADYEPRRAGPDSLSFSLGARRGPARPFWDASTPAPRVIQSSARSRKALHHIVLVCTVRFCRGAAPSLARRGCRGHSSAQAYSAQEEGDLG